MTSLKDRFIFRVRWEPFLVRPNCPREGIPKDEPDGGDMTDPGIVHLKESGADLGIQFNFNCPVYPYTVPAHVLLEYARNKHNGELQSDIVERLFKAYFTKGRSLERRHLLKVAKDMGFDLDEVKTFLFDPENEQEIRQKAYNWRSKGVSAIPFFIMNGRSVCSGAQDDDAFVSTILKVAEMFADEGETQV